MSKIWKWLFLGLLALNLALVSVVAYRIMTPVETTSSVSLPKGATKIGKYSMTREELEELVPVIIEKDIYVISDEIYSALTYNGEHCSIGSLPGMKERTIVINGFSKAL